MDALFRKLTLILALLLLGFALAACGSDQTTENTQTEDDPITITLGAYGLQLPQGFTEETVDAEVPPEGDTPEDTALLLLKDGQTVGGVVVIPCEDPTALSAASSTQERKDILDRFVNEGEDYVLGDSIYGTMELSVANADGDTVHYFYPGTSQLYDLWLIQPAVTSEEADTLASSFIAPQE